MLLEEDILLSPKGKKHLTSFPNTSLLNELNSITMQMLVQW